MHRAFLILASLIAFASIAGCIGEHDFQNLIDDAVQEQGLQLQQPPVVVGERVEIQLRRDALGLASAAPTGIDIRAPYVTRLAVAGVVVDARNDWIEIETSDHDRIAVPISSILVVKKLKQPTTRP